jgi:hypothetical protein
MIGACVLSRCGNDAPDAGIDARDDKVLDVHPDIQPSDAGVVCNEASQGTRWAGWSRVTEADPCCTVEVPDQVDASVDPLTWVPCTNDAGGCQEMPITWGVQPNWTRFNVAFVTQSTSSVTTNVVLGRRLDALTVEEDIYAFTDGRALAAWRNYLSADTGWVANAAIGSSSAWVYISGAK